MVALAKNKCHEAKSVLLQRDRTIVSLLLLDVTRLVNRLYDGTLPTGVDRVGIAYIEKYGHRARAVLSERGFVTTLGERDSQRVFGWLTGSERATRAAIRTTVARAVATGWRRRAGVPGVLLNTSHTGMEYPRYYRSIAARHARSVFMIHDLIPLTHAEYCRPGVDQQHRRRVRLALAHADALIANSQATFDTLAHEAELAGLPLPPTAVAHLASGMQPAGTHARPLARPYFVMLGTIEPRKNHWLMLHVWRALVEKWGAAAPTLVVIGRRGWECENVVDMLERCAPIRDFVIEKSNCSDAELQAWLSHAQALLFPSFAEGYGIPLVEALELGVPVIASRLDAFAEISADIPDYLDPLDGRGWQQAIESYAEAGSPARAAQLARVERFVAPTWDAHFEHVDALLRTLTGA